MSIMGVLALIALLGLVVHAFRKFRAENARINGIINGSIPAEPWALEAERQERKRQYEQETHGRNYL